jgi:hypothetical protein
MGTMLYGVRATDPLAFASVAVLLAVSENVGKLFVEFALDEGKRFSPRRRRHNLL